MKVRINLRIFIIIIIFSILFIQYIFFSHHVYYYKPIDIDKKILKKLNIHSIKTYITYASKHWLEKPRCLQILEYDSNFNLSKKFDLVRYSSVGCFWAIENTYDSNENVISFNRYEALDKSSDLNYKKEKYENFGFAPYLTNVTYRFDNNHNINKKIIENFYGYETYIYSGSKIIEKLNTYYSNSMISSLKYRYDNDNLLDEIKYQKTCKLNMFHKHLLYEHDDDTSECECYPNDSIESIINYKYDQFNNPIVLTEKNYANNYVITKILKYNYFMKYTEIAYFRNEEFLRKEILYYDNKNLIIKKETYDSANHLEEIESYEYL